jgi:HB1, ASXL, restriction endonuclease HTH domain
MSVAAAGNCPDPVRRRERRAALHEHSLNEGERIMATKKTTKPKAPVPAKKAKADKQPAAGADKKLSAIDAAAKVLGESGQAMNCQELIAAMAAKGYWTSPGGKTPASTLYASFLRELKVRGKQARFRKTERGKFALNAQA